jgi:hypothetical protein
MECERADEQAARQPHRPGAATDARRAVLAGEMDGLWQVGQHANRDASDAEQLEHVWLTQP